MKAIGLRFVTAFAVVTLTGGTLFLSAPTARADGSQLKAALDDYAAGKLEDALKKLQEYVAANPGDDEVYGVLRTVDESVKLRALAAGGESERLMRYLLDKARPSVEARKRDPDRIKKLVDMAMSGDIDVRRHAGLELAMSSGDYAVPYLLPHLGDTEVEKVVNAMFAFHDIGAEAVLPLCEALTGSGDARLRKYVAALLGDLKDPRALPALRRATEKDADGDVKAKASDSIRRIRPDGVAMSAAASYVKLGQMYYNGEPTMISELDQVHNVWAWEGDGLVRYEVPAGIYSYVLAERHAAEALALDPSLLAARSLLVRATLSESLEAKAMGEKAPEAAKGAWDLAVSQGFDAASAALGDAVAQRNWDVAVEACRVLAATYGGQDLAGTALERAIGATERRVQYAAAVAALRMSPSKPFAGSQQVPALAAQAASETALRQVFVIDDMNEARNHMLQDLREGGYVVADETDGYRGVARVQATPTLDVVVVRGDLGAETALPSMKWKSTMAVIDELLADARTKNMRIVVVVGGGEAAVAAKKTFLTTKYGDKIAGYVEEPLVATAYLPIIEAAVKKGELSKGGAAALAIAAEAADAFAAANAHCSAWDFKVAIDPLANNAQEGANDEIKMNAVRALGNLRAGGSAALAAILKGDAKEELKVAAAKALGQVLSRNAATGDEIDVLIASAKAGGAVGSAAMGALGQAKGVSGDALRAAYGDHKMGLGTKGE